MGMRKSAVLWCLISMFLLSAVTYQEANAADGEFKDVEVRVVRPRFFDKRGRLEIGTQMSVVMNQSFIYTYLASGNLTFHINESFGIEGSGSYGLSVDKEDKEILQSDFDIITRVVRLKYDFTGSILYTPIYGKYQLSSGRLIYFDTFLSAGGGMAGVEYLYDQCEGKPLAVPAPTANTVMYPSAAGGIGQRYFLNQNTSLRWDVKVRWLSYDAVDGQCGRDALKESGVTDEQNHFSVTMQVGVSYFL